MLSSGLILSVLVGSGLALGGPVNSIAPISIHGNSDLTPPGSASGCRCATLASGVWVIGPWQISGAPGDGVYIENVTVPFLLKDMAVIKSGSAGIHLRNVTFGAPTTVVSGVNTSLQNNDVGILVEGSSGLILNGGGANPNGWGIVASGAGTINKNHSGAVDVENSSFIQVRGWQLSANGQDGSPDWISFDPSLAHWGVGGVRFFGVNNSWIDHNAANNDTSVSYSLFQSSNNRVTGNTADYPFTANLLIADGSSLNTIDGNDFGTADFIGILLANPLGGPYTTQGNSITGNTVHSSGPTGTEIKAGISPSFSGGIVLLNGVVNNLISGNQLWLNTGNDLKWTVAVTDGASPIGVTHLPTPSACVAWSNLNTWSGNTFRTKDTCPGYQIQ